MTPDADNLIHLPIISEQQARQMNESLIASMADYRRIRRRRALFHLTIRSLFLALVIAGMIWLWLHR